MDETVAFAKAHNVLVGAHPSLPDKQGFGRREMVMEPVSHILEPHDYSFQFQQGRTGVMLYLPSRRIVRISAETWASA